MDESSLVPSLQVPVGDLTLDSPVILASGTLGECPNTLKGALEEGAGAVVTRTIRESIRPDRYQTPVPRYHIRDGTMLNCEWVNEKPWGYWLDSGVDEVSHSGPLLLSISGREIDGAVRLIGRFEDKDIAAYELNFSCPHSNAIFGKINEDCRHLRRLLERVRSVTSRQIWVKLGWSSYITQMAMIAEECGADAVVAVNSLGPGMVIDTETGVPALGISGGIGGISGSAIHPLAVAVVFELTDLLGIPVIGCGGVSSASDVLEFFMAGASAVELYSAAYLTGLPVFRAINDGLVKYMLRKGISTLDQLQGITKSKARTHNFECRVPLVDHLSCNGCGRCREVCLWRALPATMPGAIDRRLCIGCNACAYVCPTGAIEPFLRQAG